MFNIFSRIRNVLLFIFQNIILIKPFFKIIYNVYPKFIVKYLKVLNKNSIKTSNEKRMSWINFSDNFYNEFNNIAKNIFNNQCPLFFNDTYRFPNNNGKIFDNRNIIQISMPTYPSGINFKEYKNGIIISRGITPEHGASVVFSQFHTGEVGVIAYPSMIEFSKDIGNQYKVLKIYNSPNDITNNDIRFYIFFCVIYSYETSYYGSLSFSTRVRNFCIDNKNNLVLIVISTIVGYLIGKI